MFAFEPRGSFNGFPENIHVHGNILGYSLNYNLSKIQGLAKNSSLNGRVYSKNNLDSEINELNSDNLVIRAVLIAF